MAVCSACTTAITATAFFGMDSASAVVQTRTLTGDELDDAAKTTGAAIKYKDNHTCVDDSNCVCLCTEYTVPSSVVVDNSSDTVFAVDLYH